MTYFVVLYKNLMVHKKNKYYMDLQQKNKNKKDYKKGKKEKKKKVNLISCILTTTKLGFILRN